MTGRLHKFRQECLPHQLPLFLNMAKAIVNSLIGCYVHMLIQRIAGTVMARASVDTKSMEALSDSAALYRAAKSTTTVARGKLQYTSASRANGLSTRKICSKANRTADCRLTRAKEPTNTVGERRTG